MLAALIAGIATLLISVLPTLSFGYRSEHLHIGLETAAAVISGVAAFLLYGRYRTTRRADALALCLALILLTAANAGRAIAPGLSGATPDSSSVWPQLFLQFLAWLLLAVESFSSRRRIERRDVGPIGLLVALCATLAIVLGALLLAPHLATDLDPRLSPGASDLPRVVGSPGLLASQLAAMLFFFTASVGFTIRARREDDELLAWLALAATVGAFGRLNYFLFPSVYSGWVFTGDFLRVATYLLILAGVLRQISAYQRAAAEAAVLKERRRIALDIHDGLAQELAFISMRASSLAQDDDRIESIAEAAEQALADSRAAITSLDSAEGEPLGASITRLATRLCGRAGVALRLEVEEGLEAEQERREALLRIVSEAIGNAVRHGQPSLITVELSGGTSLRLGIRDDGSGFDEARVAAGVGLEGMRERVDRIGGEFHVGAGLGRGTEVEVVLP